MHALGGGDVGLLVQDVGYGVQLELRTLRRKVRFLRAGIDLGDVVVVDEPALELPLGTHERGADLWA